MSFEPTKIQSSPLQSGVRVWSEETESHRYSHRTLVVTEATQQHAGNYSCYAFLSSDNSKRSIPAVVAVRVIGENTSVKGSKFV